MNKKNHVKSDEMFTIANAREIQSLLNRLIDHRCLFTAHFGDSHQFLLTTILGFSKDGRELMLDVSPNDIINQRALASPILLLHTRLEQVEVRFRTGPLVMDSYEGLPVLRAPVPAQMIYLQWRELFRLSPPLSQPLLCNICLPGPEGIKCPPVQMRVLDISGGGVALQVPPGQAADFLVDTHLDDCCIDLPDAGVIRPQLIVRYVTQSMDNKRQPRTRAGCEFSSTTPAMRSLIQQYVMRTERERIARSQGLM
jgi:c-di-GMP-binding flagellar brake protein YcgR